MKSSFIIITLIFFKSIAFGQVQKPEVEQDSILSSYGFRIYNTRLGTLLAPDAKKKPENSPYPKDFGNKTIILDRKSEDKKTVKKK